MPPVIAAIYDFAVHRPFAVEGAKFFATHVDTDRSADQIAHVILNMAPCSVAGGAE
jgi:hypothetical protein